MQGNSRDAGHSCGQEERARSPPHSDLISQKFYQTPTLYEEIIKANPEIPIEPILLSGIKLKIPILEDSETIKI